MSDKGKKIKSFLFIKGFHFNSLSAITYFVKRCFQFVFKYRTESFKVLRDKIRNQPLNPSRQEMDSYGPHNHLMNKIRPKNVDFTKMKWAIPNIKKKYSITIVVSAGNYLMMADTLTSIDKQVYRALEIIIEKGFFKPSPKTFYPCEARVPFAGESEYQVADSLKEAVDRAAGDYILLLKEGDLLQREALFEFIMAMNLSDNMPAMIYSDHDYLHENKIMLPYYKPGWSPDLLLVNNYIKRACYFKTSALKNASIDFSLDDHDLIVYDALLKVPEKGPVANFPGIFITFPYEGNEDDYNEKEDALRQKTLNRRGQDAKVTSNQYFVTSLDRKLNGNPKISIIIPTCYTKDYIEKCLSSIEKRTTYKNYEIIVVDNSRKNPKYGQSRVGKYPCRILYINEPFNWARLNNLAARESSGSLLLFLNDDTEVITQDWLERMAAEAQRPEIGVVGPLLLYPDGKVQSAGGYLVNYGGGGKHFFLNHEETSASSHHYLHYRRECSFLTGACIMVEKKKFDEIGGFNESFYLIANDTDFNLRLRKMGYRNLFIPEIRLYHKELASRYELNESEAVKDTWSVWRQELEKPDPYFNPYLDHTRDIDVIDINPTVYRMTGSPSISSENIKKILIVKLDHIGDVILALPAVRKIRRMFPNAQIDMLCGPWAKGMLEMQPEIDRMITFTFFDARSQNGIVGNNKTDIMEMIRELKKEKYDLSVNLRRHEETKAFTVEAADFSLAFSDSPETDVLTHPLPALKNIGGLKPKWNIGDQLMTLVNTIDYDESLNGEIVISDEVNERVIQKLASKEAFKSELVVGIHAGVGSYLRQWPYEKFARLADILVENTNATIVFTGSEDEIELNKKIINNMKHQNHAVSVAGEFSLIEFCSLVKKFDYFIGNNSGPIHIAAIQDVPTLGIYSGVAYMQEWAPIGKKFLVVSKNMDCSPCYYAHREQCPELPCLNRISPYDVYSGLKRLMVLFPKN